MASLNTGLLGHSVLPIVVSDLKFILSTLNLDGETSKLLYNIVEKAIIHT